jgi:hypothetical protein
VIRLFLTTLFGVVVMIDLKLRACRQELAEAEAVRTAAPTPAVLPAHMPALPPGWPQTWPQPPVIDALPASWTPEWEIR